MKAQLARAALIAAALLTSACGFHLRGQSEHAQAQVKSVYLDAKATNGEVLRKLRRDLKASGVTLTSKPSEAELVVSLGKEESERRVISVGYLGRAAEYQLSSSISYSFRDKSGETVLGPELATAERVYLHDVDRVVSTANQQAEIQQNINDNIAGQILRRIETYRPAPSAPKAP